jgi:NitT/TauT family transport system ATP-binding protein
MPDTPAVRLREVHVSFPARGRGARAVEALAGCSLEAHPGSFTAVVGPSGCGKTTLLEVVCGLLTPGRGSVEAAPAVLMPQRDLLLPWLDALDNAALPLRLRGAARAAARDRARPLFAAFGLDGFERSPPGALSGGMRQRVAFLRTLLAEKPVLCLDEPFAGLDALTRADMRDWLTGALAREQRTTLLVTHDVEEAVVLADHVLVLTPRPGRVTAALDVPLPRPRRPTDPAVVALRAAVLEALQA